MPIITTHKVYINTANYKTITHTLTSAHIYTYTHCTTQTQNDTPKGRVEVKGEWKLPAIKNPMLNF